MGSDLYKKNGGTTLSYNNHTQQHTLILISSDLLFALQVILNISKNQGFTISVNYIDIRNQINTF